MNKVILEGFVGKDPEIRNLPNGTMVCSASLSTSNNYKKDGQWVKQPPSWHRLVAFGKFAEALAECRKRQRAKVEGKLVYSEWTDSEGIKRVTVEICVFSVSTNGKTDPGAAGS
jgi:single-strand DNA-binding protein